MSTASISETQPLPVFVVNQSGSTPTSPSGTTLPPIFAANKKVFVLLAPSISGNMSFTADIKEVKGDWVRADVIGAPTGVNYGNVWFQPASLAGLWSFTN